MQRLRRTRAWRGAAVAAAVALGLAACSSSGAGSSTGGASAQQGWTIPEQDPTATISVLSILTTKQMQPVINAFEKAHPTIKLKWQTVPFDALASTVDARVSNKAGDPDVYWADQPRISALAARGELEDLTAAFSKNKDSFAPTAYDAGVYQEKLWALPIANSTQLLYYNKTLLDKAKVKHPSADPAARMTWEDLVVDAKKAKDAGATYGFTFGQVDRYYQLEALPVSKGGSAGATGEGNLTPDITSQPWVDAFSWYGKLFADKVSPRGVTPEVSDANFIAGKSAYMVQGPWLLPQLTGTKVEWGVAPHPQFAGGKAATPTGSWSLGMNPFSKNKEATAIFMKWMSIDEGSGYIKYFAAPELAANVEGKKLYLAKDVFSSAEGQKAAKIIDFETANTAVNRLSTVGYIEFEEILNRAFADIRNGSDAKKSLEAASKELESAWSKYR